MTDQELREKTRGLPPGSYAEENGVFRPAQHGDLVALIIPEVVPPTYPTLFETKLCPECHHKPSMRDGDPAHCYCKCHDVADAAPELLEACEAVVDECEAVFVHPEEMSDSWVQVYRQLRAAIARARGEVLAPDP